MKQIITLCLFCILLLCGCSSAAPAQMSTSLPKMVEPETTAAIAPDKTEKTAPVTLTLFVRNFDSTLGGMLGQGSGKDPIMAEIQREVEPDTLTIHHNIAVIAAVGRKMAHRPGISGKIFAALGNANINIRMINQSPDELNIILAVNNEDFEAAIRVLYNSFVK